LIPIFFIIMILPFFFSKKFAMLLIILFLIFYVSLYDLLEKIGLGWMLTKSTTFFLQKMVEIPIKQ